MYDHHIHFPDITTCFFVDGLGGAGKTFLYNTLLATVRAEGGIALPVASSGIAALLLEGGRTAHSRFQLPVNNLSSNSNCNITKQSKEELIRCADLIIWDEAPMLNKHNFEALDRTLRDITNIDDQPFGGKVVVMGGDFRQVLPVVLHGNPPQVVNAALKKSRLWSYVKILHLHLNMRVQMLLQSGHTDNAERQQNFDHISYPW